MAIHYIYPLIQINPLNAELNTICHLLASLGAHHIFHVSGLRVKYKKLQFTHRFLYHQFYYISLHKAR